MRKILSKMPSGVKMSGGTPASVLVAICGSDMRVLLTKKAANLRIHAGQISFPGGKPETNHRVLDCISVQLHHLSSTYRTVFLKHTHTA